MKNILLIDFGSTYTKVTAVDEEKEVLLGTAASYTTVEEDINIGLTNALSKLKEKVGDVEFYKTLACSSAAGGLRIVASGLVPELTAEAAKMASLGAGGKVLKTFAYELTEDDIEEIDEINPEIVLLVGGTDGGNTEVILHNAEALSKCKSNFSVIIAGNRVVARKCKEFFTNHYAVVVENVMPKLSTLNIDPAKAKIRELFLDRIVKAKGMTKAQELISDIVMPTPSAMMRAMELLADGIEDTEDEELKGVGEIIAVDVGGATTDVYSIADGYPKKSNVVYKGLQEPYIKRTVDGDIGMRYGIKGILEAVGSKYIAEKSGIDEAKALDMIEYLSKNTETVPENDEWANLDKALASGAVETATVRHAGTVQEVYTPCGFTEVQEGKDLTKVQQIIVTGGSLIHAKDVGEIAKHAMYQKEHLESLRPSDAKVLVDEKYILSGMGLLAGYKPELAIKIMKKELKEYGINK